MKSSFDTSNFLEEISNLSHLIVFLLFLCTVHLIRPSYLSMLFSGTLHSVGSVSQFNHSVVSNSLRPHGLQHARPPCPSLTAWVYTNSCPLSRWCHPTISSSVIPLFFSLQSLPASGSFTMSQFFTSGGQNIGASVPPMNIQDWFPLGLSGWICLQSKGLLSTFSNTTVQKHQSFATQLSL